jgi:sugar lactone lactonase YvrE
VAGPPKTVSDGIALDAQGRIYVTDPEHSALHRIDTEGVLQTLVRDPRLRWPDGLSVASDGSLYVSCSALHEVVLKSPIEIARTRPYHIFRLDPL